MRDKKARIGQGDAGRLTLVKTGIVRSITAIHHEEIGAPHRWAVPVCFPQEHPLLRKIPVVQDHAHDQRVGGRERIVKAIV